MKEQRASVRHYRHGRQNFMASASAEITRAALRARVRFAGSRASRSTKSAGSDAERLASSTSRLIVGEAGVRKREGRMYDLVIRGATVVDGLGHEPMRAHVAIKDGRIAAIGHIRADATEIGDAGGLSL